MFAFVVWDFDIFKADRLTSGNALIFVGHALFERRGFLEIFNFKREVFDQHTHGYMET